jgi:hypothetical protein
MLCFIGTLWKWCKKCSLISILSPTNKLLIQIRFYVKFSNARKLCSNYSIECFHQNLFRDLLKLQYPWNFTYVLFQKFWNKLLEKMVFGLGLLNLKFLCLQFAKQQQNYKNKLSYYLSYRQIWLNLLVDGY